MLPIHERFLTWQGEGVHMGRAAFFIRTFGCPMHCPWCDSAGTWHPSYVPKQIERMDEKALMFEAEMSGAPIVVVTGGEPAVHDLLRLTSLIKRQNRHIETSGAFPIKGTFDWITVSPKNKWAKPVTDENILLADEFKLIIEHPDDLSYWAPIIQRGGYRGQPIWLHPEWSKRNDASVLNAISAWVKDAGETFRVGYQLHKLYKVDVLDNRTAAPVPLGGNPSLGY